jgi:hypothetical protein
MQSALLLAAIVVAPAAAAATPPTSAPSPAAAATSVSSVTFAGNPATAGAVATWTVGFVASPSGALKRGSSVTVVLDAGFKVPAAPAVSLSGSFANCSASASASGSTVRIKLGGGQCGLANGATGRVALAGITNPAAGTYPAGAFSVATSSDTTPAAPATAVVITAVAGTVGAVTFTGSSQASGTVSTWTVGFTTSTTGALAAGAKVSVVFNTSFLVPSTPTIGLTTGFSNCSASASTSGTNHTTVSIALTNGAGTCALPASTAARLTIAGITNPSAGTYPASSFSVATTRDGAASPASAVVIGSASATFTAPAPGTTVTQTATTYTVTWTESGVTARTLLTERAAPSSGACPTSGFATLSSTSVSTAGSAAVSGLTAGSCYRFELDLNGATSPAATSGTILVVASSSSADPSKLTTSYALPTTVTLGSSNAYVYVTETVSITNNNSASITTVNFSALARALGYFYLQGVDANGTSASNSWTTTTNLAVSVPPTAPGATVTVLIDFELVIPYGAGSSAFALRMNYYNGILLLGNWFPIVSIVHDAYGIGDPQVTWNAQTIDFTLTTASSYVRDAVSATGELISAPSSSGSSWHFTAKNVRDYAVAISPSYHMDSGGLTKPNGGTVILKSYARSATTAATMLSIAKSAFATYLTYYGDYPYATYSISEAGSTGFSMEYPNQVFIGSTYTASSYVIWHETAHQWFYGMLGDNQISEPWLDESWAEFSARYFLGLSLTDCSTVPVNEPITFWPGTLTGGDWSGCNGYTETIYHRGTTFINAIRADMGTSAFFAAIAAYVSLHRYGLVAGTDELRYLDAQTNYDLWGGPVYTYTSYR